ncbi:MAG: hypothetical protein KY410_08770, partial [Proteobacteria bacterium]|nr:hypothetical protein [Pseudomonadota bacterium]
KTQDERARQSLISMAQSGIDTGTAQSMAMKQLDAAAQAAKGDRQAAGVGDLFASVHEAHAAAMSELSTSELTRVLEDAVQQHQPPLVRGRRIRLRYAHQGGKRPPMIVIHGNQTERVPDAYRRYLENIYRERFRLFGTPIKIEFRTGDNPFKGRRNTLTPRQIQKKKRMMKHYKGRK